MDKLKPFFAGLARNQFWILSVVIVLTSLVVWYMATGELDAKFMRDKNTNQSAFNGVDQKILNQHGMNLPNPEFAKDVEKVRTALGGEVQKAWTNLFERQRQVLHVTPTLGDLQPYLVDEKKWTEQIPVGMREQFHNNEIIEKEFRDLFTILNLRRPQGINPVDPVPAGQQPSPEGLVVWAASPSPRDLMSRYKTRQTPSSTRIRMMYEDLWVFRSLFNMIAKINARPVNVWLDILDGQPPVDAAVDQANVPIKRINFCDLAQYATSNVTGGGGYTVGGMGGENPDEDSRIIVGRYLDGRNMPVADPNAPPFTEFKQIFVQLSVVMDQRLVPVLISECANADITLETRQVLIDLSEVDNLKKGNAQEAAQIANRIEQLPNDVTVTLRGVVYGYSPPDATRLGGGSDPEPSKRDYGIPVNQ